MNNRWIIRENYVGAAIFGLLAFGGALGMCAGNTIHLLTTVISGSVSWVVSIRFTTYFLEVFENIWDKIWRN